uniref:Uncharacterized protein n=2 Tax=Anthurium amnicola TaxID=1678845 RepID=A0A1D1Z3M7_9ARAE
MPSQVLSSSLSESRNDSFLPESYSHMQSMQGLGHVTISSIPKQQQQQHCWLGSYFDSTEPVKQASHPLRPFFDEWPKTRVSWSDLEDERSSGVSSSTTQLSISLPMPSDFTTTSRSPNGVP